MIPKKTEGNRLKGKNFVFLQSNFVETLCNIDGSEDPDCRFLKSIAGETKKLQTLR